MGEGGWQNKSSDSESSVASRLYSGESCSRRTSPLWLLLRRKDTPRASISLKAWRLLWEHCSTLDFQAQSWTSGFMAPAARVGGDTPRKVRGVELKELCCNTER